MEKLIHLLHEGDYSCVIENGEIRTFTQRGVADLFRLLKEEPAFLRGASVADKVVGKAAAALMILGGIKEIYTDTISSPALELFRHSGIEPAFGKEVPHIINRDGTDWCPMEKLSFNEKSAETILPLIESFLNKMRNISSAK